MSDEVRESSESCESCRFWGLQLTGRYHSDCKRHAPTIHNLDPQTTVWPREGQWPQTGRYAWCGDYERKPRE